MALVPSSRDTTSRLTRSYRKREKYVPSWNVNSSLSFPNSGKIYTTVKKMNFHIGLSNLQLPNINNIDSYVKNMTNEKKKNIYVTLV